MKIKPEELSKIIGEEVVNVLQENILQKMLGDVTDLYTRLNVPSGRKEEPQQTAAKPEEKPEEKPTLKTMSRSDLQKIFSKDLEKNIKILMGQTNPVFLNTIKPLLKAFAPENFLSDIVKRARIDDTTIFKKQIINFIEKMETYSSVSLQEEESKEELLKKQQELKNKIKQKRKLLSNIDKVMSSVRKQIFLKLSQQAEKDISGIRQNIIEYIEENKEKLAEINIQIAQKLKTEGSEEWLLKELKQDIMAISNCLVLITKQTILNAYAQKDIPG